MDQEPELKPCPFCGGSNTLIEPGGRVWAGTRWGEPTSYKVIHWCLVPLGQPTRRIERVGRDIESAVKAWNERV